MSMRALGGSGRIELIDNTVFGTYGAAGEAVIAELQALVGSRSWRIDYIPEEGKFSILRCDPTVQKQEIEAIFAQRVGNPRYRTEICDSFYQGNRQFTLMATAANSGRASGRNALGINYSPAIPGIPLGSHLPQEQFIMPVVAPLPEMLSGSTRVRQLLEHLYGHTSLEGNPLPSVSGAVPIDPSLQSQIDAARRTLEQTVAPSRMGDLFSRSAPFEFDGGPTSQAEIDASRQEFEREMAANVHNNALLILRPSLQEAQQLRPEQPAIRLQVSGRASPPLQAEMRRIIAELGARINLEFV